MLGQVIDLFDVGIVHPEGEAQAGIDCHALYESSHLSLVNRVLVHGDVTHCVDTIQHRVCQVVALVINVDSDSHLIASVSTSALVGEGLLTHEERGTVTIREGIDGHLLGSVGVQEHQAGSPRQVVCLISGLDILADVKVEQFIPGFKHFR